jgi:antagonist of KipI
VIKIIKPGLLTTIQDLGRYGFQKFGVIVSGVMDSLSHRIANLLVGNEENAPTLEITMVGPVIEFERDTLISICGGDLSPSIDGKFVPLWRPVFVKKGSQLRFGQCKAGCRSYLAVAGGFDVPRVMGSASTYLRAGIGGFKGRPLQAGDELKLSPPNNRSIRMIHDFSSKLGDRKFVGTKWSVSAEFIPISNKIPSIRVIKGRQYHLFSKESQKSFFREPFEITTQSDRMGYRLKGPILSLASAEEMISEAVNFGTIQVPPDGNPIVLLADRQTTGGYPKIGQVATVDLPYIAQLKPGDKIKFVEVSHEEAQRLYLEREREIQQLKRALSIKWKGEM